MATADYCLLILGFDAWDLEFPLQRLLRPDKSSLLAMAERDEIASGLAPLAKTGKKWDYSGSLLMLGIECLDFGISCGA